MTHAALPIVKKIAIIIFAALLCGLSALEAYAGLAQSGRPADAVPFWPWRGIAPALQADQMREGLRSGHDVGAIRDLARDSVLAQAVNPRAIRLLGEVADANHQPAEASKLMFLADQLSRRDVLAQFWLINHEAGQNRLVEALAHYDAALRTSPEASKLLFPTLITALDSPAIQTAFIPVLKADPPWLNQFLGYAIGQSAHPQILVDLLKQAGGISGTPAHRDLALALVNRLVAMRQYQDARVMFLNMSGVEPGVLASTALNTATSFEQAGAFGWQITTTPTIGGSLIGDGDHGRMALQVFAGSGERAQLAQKTVFLQPGAYVFQARYDRVQLGRGAAIEWQLQCLKASGASLVWQTNGADAALRSRPALVVVPAGCDAFAFGLSVGGGNDQTGTEFRVGDVSLKRQS